jgi:hypothetical protein
MIKCDVDGFDSTALMSDLGDTRDQPLIYFESEVREQGTFVRIRQLCDRLANTGYDMFTRLDNFGLLMIENAPLDVVSNCLQYVYCKTRVARHVASIPSTSRHHLNYRARLSGGTRSLQAHLGQ